MVRPYLPDGTDVRARTLYLAERRHPVLITASPKPRKSKRTAVIAMTTITFANGAACRNVVVEQPFDFC